jgi:hypothetical protein
MNYPTNSFLRFFRVALNKIFTLVELSIIGFIGADGGFIRQSR